MNFGTPDDLDMFEWIQRGLSIPEMEWIDMSRGLPDGGAADGTDGTIYGPITSEAPQRRYLAHYAKLMTTSGGHPCPLTPTRRPTPRGERSSRSEARW